MYNLGYESCKLNVCGLTRFNENTFENVLCVNTLNKFLNTLDSRSSVTPWQRCGRAGWQKDLIN